MEKKLKFEQYVWKGSPIRKLAKIPKEYKDIIMLLHKGGLGYETISRLTKINISTSAVRDLIKNYY